MRRHTVQGASALLPPRAISAVALAGLMALAACRPDGAVGPSAVNAVDLPGASFAAGAGKNSTVPKITSLVLQSTTIQIGTPMPYSLTLTNPGAPLDAVWVLGELVQSGKTWAGGSGVQCPGEPFAHLPTGTCTFGFEVDFPEQHKLKPGNATFVLRLLQQDPSGASKEFDRVSVRVTLTN